MREHYPIIGRPATLISAATLATTAGLAASRLALAAAACAVAGLAAIAVVTSLIGRFSSSCSHTSGGPTSVAVFLMLFFPLVPGRGPA